MNLRDFRRIAVKVKRNVTITASWSGTLLMFMTLASLMYSFSTLLQSYFPSYLMFFLVTLLIFFPLYYAIGELIIRLGIYGEELAYSVEIDPYQRADGRLKLSEKERELGWPMWLLVLDQLRMLMQSHDLFDSETEAIYNSYVLKVVNLLDSVDAVPEWVKERYGVKVKA